ncbi:hypothetical protein DFH07DRAFT_756850, partial [Mycena maculata]
RNVHPSPPTSVSGAEPKCAGACYRWDIGSLCTTYPFCIHEPTSRKSPGYTLLSTDFVQSVIHVRSVDCLGSVTAIRGCCDSCDTLDSSIKTMEKWSQQSFGK